MEIPAGTLEPARILPSARIRELQEEIGYKANDLKLMFRSYLAPGYSTEMLHTYMARGLEQVEAEREPDEFIEVVEVPLPDALEMIQSGEIKDAKTICGVLMAVKRLEALEGCKVGMLANDAGLTVTIGFDAGLGETVTLGLIANVHVLPPTPTVPPSNRPSVSLASTSTAYLTPAASCLVEISTFDFAPEAERELFLLAELGHHHAVVGRALAGRPLERQLSVDRGNGLVYLRPNGAKNPAKVDLLPPEPIVHLRAPPRPRPG